MGDERLPKTIMQWQLNSMKNENEGVRYLVKGQKLCHYMACRTEIGQTKNSDAGNRKADYTVKPGI